MNFYLMVIVQTYLQPIVYPELRRHYKAYELFLSGGEIRLGSIVGLQ